MRVRRRLRARTRRACLGVNNHTTTDEFICHERRESQKRRGGKASGIADVRRLAYRLAVRLGQAVNERALCIHRRVLAFVISLEHFAVAQAKVARQVNDLQALRQTRHNINRLPVREREKDEIQILQAL